MMFAIVDPLLRGQGKHRRQQPKSAFAGAQAGADGFFHQTAPTEKHKHPKVGAVAFTQRLLLWSHLLLVFATALSRVGSG
jgi:hypothetical protein